MIPNLCIHGTPQFVKSLQYNNACLDEQVQWDILYDDRTMELLNILSSY